MKLATLKDSTRDGKLVVVSKDLTRCSEVGHIARSLQAALDDWAHVAPRLQRVAQGLETGSQPTMRFHEHDAASPLPRAYVWSGGAGTFHGPRDTVSILGGSTEIAVTAQLAVITDDVAAGTADADTEKSILLVLIAKELFADGHAIGSTFSPVAVTPDELGSAWSDGAAKIALMISHNGRPLDPSAATADFRGAISCAAKVRALGVGSIVAAGASATRETVASGDTVRVELNDRSGHSIFGAIEQVIATKAG